VMAQFGSLKKNADRLTQLNTNTRPTNGITITEKVSKSNY